MEYVEKLSGDREYRQLLERLKELEKDRIYCHHGIGHLLDVARIAYIENLEAQLGLEKEDIYIAALLHDLGRVDEYESGIGHHIAGRKRARYFLQKIDYPWERQAVILDAIAEHRNKENIEGNEAPMFHRILVKADRGSRNCRFCDAYESCKWSVEEKEHRIER